MNIQTETITKTVECTLGELLSTVSKMQIEGWQVSNKKIIDGRNFSITFIKNKSTVNLEPGEYLENLDDYAILMGHHYGDC